MSTPRVVALPQMHVIGLSFTSPYTAFAWFRSQRIAQLPGALWLERYGPRYDSGSPSKEFEIDLPVT